MGNLHVDCPRADNAILAAFGEVKDCIKENDPRTEINFEDLQDEVCARKSLYKNK